MHLTAHYISIPVRNMPQLLKKSPSVSMITKYDMVSVYSPQRSVLPDS